MKGLRPGGKSMANVNRTASNPGTPTTTNGPELPRVGVDEQDGSKTIAQPTPALRTNPIGSGSAFGWLNSGTQRKTTTTGGP